jgi:hypothetical protein
LVLLGAGVLAVPAPVGACAVVPARDVIVETASESAIIAWDPATKTQHFIRRAAFNATANTGAKVEDFGFLVPTPTQPVLEEVSDQAFDELAKVTAPKEQVQKRPSGCAIGCGAAEKMPVAGSAPPGHSVEVLDEKHVAGFDAKVLKATDAEVLAAWLKEHNYESRPAVARWLKPYVEKGWIVTAFKITRAPGSPAGAAVGTSAVRMSFTTDAPFFPYSEPEDMRDSKTRRLLRVFFLGDLIMTGKLGTSDWPGKAVWAGRVPAESARTIAPLLKVPGFKLDENTRLTEFEDHSSPRRGDSDVTFTVNPDQTPVERPTRIIYSQRPDAAGKAAFAALALGVIGVYLLQRLRFAPRRRS